MELFLTITVAIVMIIINIAIAEEDEKYNLTIWQRITLIPLWFIWIRNVMEADADSMERGRGDWKDNVKTWHQVKKGMEKHTHVYKGEILHDEGFPYLKCTHEGCKVICPVDCGGCKNYIKADYEIVGGRYYDGKCSLTGFYTRFTGWCNKFEEKQTKE